MSDLVGNPEDLFSRVAAHIVPTKVSASYSLVLISSVLVLLSHVVMSGSPVCS